MFVQSEGLYNNLQLKQDIPAGRFKPYTYTTKDFEDNKSKIPVARITVNGYDTKFRLNNGILRINNLEYDITNLSLDELLETIREEVPTIESFNYISGYEVFSKLPAILLSNFNTESFDQIEGVISPLDISEYITSNTSIIPMDTSISSIDIFDLANNKLKTFSMNGNNLFYDVSLSTRIIIRRTARDFYIFADYDSKHSTIGNSVGNLIAIGSSV